jgi:hypothetical protein
MVVIVGITLRGAFIPIGSMNRNKCTPQPMATVDLSPVQEIVTVWDFIASRPVLQTLCCANDCANGISVRAPKPMHELARLIYL